jgi:predicted enzyme related to lactoylglutathione lyase
MLMGNPVVHWEIACVNGPKQQVFYTELFGWKVNANNPMNYGLVDTGGGINGGIFEPPAGKMAYVALYVQVDDLQTYLDKATRLGGQVLMPPTPIPGGGQFAMFADPEGNKMGLVHK